MTESTKTPRTRKPEPRFRCSSCGARKVPTGDPGAPACSACNAPLSKRPLGKDSYQCWLADIKAGGWATELITFDALPTPEGLQKIVESVGLQQYEAWVMRALEAGDIPDDRTPLVAEGPIEEDPPTASAPEDDPADDVQPTEEDYPEEPAPEVDVAPRTPPLFRLEALAEGTRFRVNLHEGTLLSKGKSSCKVRVVHLETGKSETASWSPATEVFLARENSDDEPGARRDNEGDGGCIGQASTNREGDTTMSSAATAGLRVSLDLAKRVMEACGLPGARKYTVLLATKKILLLDKMSEQEVIDAKDGEDAECRDAIDAIREVLAEGGEVEITEEKGHKIRAEVNGHGRPEKKGKVKEKPAPKVEKVSGKGNPKKETERDRFGNRLGTQAAAINAAIGKRPITLAKIAEKCSVTVPRLKDHIKFLVKKGVKVVSNESGVSLRD